MLRDLVSPAAGKQRHDRLFRVEAVPRGEFRASHRRVHDVDEGMADEIHGHARIAVDFLFEGEDHHHAVHQALYDAHAPSAPSPHLRADEISYRNAAIFQAARNAQMRSRRIDEDGEFDFAARGFAGEAILHADYRGNLVQHLRDANDGDFVVIGDQFNACRGHARAAHAEKLRARFARAARWRGAPHTYRSRLRRRRSGFRRHESGWAMRRGAGVSHRLAKAEESQEAAPGKGAASSCSLYCSW